MNASQTILQRVIEGTDQYVVQLSQRRNSWETMEWNLLSEDPMELYEEDSRRNHFIGSIVTMPTHSIAKELSNHALGMRAWHRANSYEY